ncbi:MAG: hypothetical protein WKG07_06175 [Hymenobacter sp.]
MDSLWNYHLYISYENSLLPYGAPTDVRGLWPQGAARQLRPVPRIGRRL